MNFTLDWQTLAAELGVATAIAGIVWRLVMMGARERFASQEDHDALSNRLAAAENRLSAAPGHADFAALGARIAAVETGVAVAQASIAGIDASVKRTEHMVELLVKHELDGGK